MTIKPRDASLLASYCADVKAGIPMLAARQDVIFNDPQLYQVFDAFEGKEAPEWAIRIYNDLKEWAGV